jgi:pyruvate dehydrogenase E2 component (dihydrolipoamide acetyltransferase)
MVIEFRLPELGENIDSGDVIKILVSEGETITKEQSVIEIETDKATIEVPAPVGGIVKKIHIKEGEKIHVGQLIMAIETGGEDKKETKKGRNEVKEIQKEKILEVQAQPLKVEGKNLETDLEKLVGGEVVQFINPSSPILESAPAAPSVRRLARELGVDISKVPCTGPRGRISEEDVRNYARSLIANSKGSKAQDQPIMHQTALTLPDFTKWGEIERKPMGNVRRKTAENMSVAWATVPHVTQHDNADITNLEQIRKDFGKKVEDAGGRLTLTAIVIKVVASALNVFPQFNSSVDMSKNEVIYKKYYHIRVAVDTDRGLIVPVIKDVDKKNIIELSLELGQMAEKARTKKITLEEMQGGTFSISNLGGIGGTYFSPIIYWPEVAVLGISRSKVEPVFINGKFEPRLILPLSLSYDHRVIDGADGVRFLRWIAEVLEQPFKLILEGV